MVKRYGWIPDIGDARDRTYSVVAPKKLPKTVDLRDKCPPVYNQGQLGACSSHATGAMMAFHSSLNSTNLGKWKPSRLFIYYNTRVIEHTVASDAGAQIRNSIKSAVKYGAPNESLWPYSDKSPGSFTVEPTPAAYTEGLKHIATSYERIPRTISAMRTCLASGNPFVFGFSVYENFESDAVAKSGVLGMPDTKIQMLGGHAVMAVGYTENTFIIRNSWGKSFGTNGYFTMPIAYLMDENLSDDFWTIKTIL